MPQSSDSTAFRCGYAGLVGRPNVGKSTLVNQILGRKLSIVSPKPQTTRWSVLGIKSTPNAQILFVDTPGLQKLPRRALNRHMNRELFRAVRDMDVVALVVVALQWRALDERALELLVRHDKRIVLVINKIDQVAVRDTLLAYIEQVAARHSFQEIIPVSALRGENLPRLEQAIGDALPSSPPLYSETQHSDRDERFFAAEFIREKLMCRLGKELPYHLTVTIEEFVRDEKMVRVRALIWVESRGQKKIAIGQGGRVLKAVGREARQDMEKLFNCKVCLSTWIKVRPKWAATSAALSEFGYAP